ncbi:MAG: radical SAM protein, partial [bacterium]|nr:radical SAM protein [bacterium]
MKRDVSRLWENERGRRSRPGTALSACAVWGDDYASGVANLGHQRVWALADDAPGWSADRLYDLDRPEGRPVSFAWNRPLGSFDLVLASVSFENDYPGLLDTLRSAGLLAGGVAPSLNPLHLAPFFDAVYSGDAETVLPSVLEGMHKNPPHSREEAWSLFGKFGLHVDALGAPGERQIWTSRSYAASETVHPAGHFGETALVELGRGCPRSCRFCAVGWMAGGYRPADPDALREQILKSTGDLKVNRVGLVGAAVAEGDDFQDLLRWLKERGLRATVSSLRADLLNEDTARLLVELGQRTLTLSAEAGSQGLRDTLG